MWAALDAISDEHRLWSRDRTGFGPDELQAKRGSIFQNKGQGYVATLADRQVRTLQLQSVLDRFGLTHVDLMSVDCEGCEEKALASLNFSLTSVDAFNIERPNCDLTLKLVRSGYVVLPLWWHNDVAFLHARLASRIPPPSLWLNDRVAEHPDLMREKAATMRGFSTKGSVHIEDLVKSCPGIEESVWRQDDPEWPPPRVLEFGRSVGGG